MPNRKLRLRSVPPSGRRRLSSSSIAMSSSCAARSTASADQLTCDTLKLSLVPGDKTTKNGTEPKSKSKSEV